MNRRQKGRSSEDDLNFASSLIEPRFERLESGDRAREFLLAKTWGKEVGKHGCWTVLQCDNYACCLGSVCPVTRSPTLVSRLCAQTRITGKYSLGHADLPFSVRSDLKEGRRPRSCTE